MCFRTNNQTINHKKLLYNPSPSKILQIVQFTNFILKIQEIQKYIFYFLGSQWFQSYCFSSIFIMVHLFWLSYIKYFVLKCFALKIWVDWRNFLLYFKTCIFLFPINTFEWSKSASKLYCYLEKKIE